MENSNKEENLHKRQQVVPTQSYATVLQQKKAAKTEISQEKTKATTIGIS